MNRQLNVTVTARCAGAFMRALPLTDIDAGRLERLSSVVLHQAVELKAYLVMHALSFASSGAYVILMIWLIASSLATLRLRDVIRIGPPVAILGALCAGAATHAKAGDDPSGVWLTQAGIARVRIGRCGSELCGIVVWLKNKIDPATGRPFTDNRNPDPVLAKRQMIGLPLFFGMRSSGPGKWSGGIYNADDGKTYAGNLSVSGPSTLKVEGCAGALCGSEQWTRSR